MKLMRHVLRLLLLVTFLSSLCEANIFGSLSDTLHSWLSGSHSSSYDRSSIKLSADNKDVVEYGSNLERLYYQYSPPSDLCYDRWELDDRVLLSTVSGSLIAYDLENNRKIWEIPPKHKPLPSNIQFFEKTNTTWCVEPFGDGAIFFFDLIDGLFQLPFTVKELVSMSPFKLPRNDYVFVGKRETSLLYIDLESGNILREISTKLKSSTIITDENDFRFKEEKSIVMGKAEYTITVFGLNSTWSMSYTTWERNFIDPSIIKGYRGSKHERSLTPLYGGKVLLESLDRQTKPQIIDFGATVTHRFDIIRPIREDHYETKKENIAIEQALLYPQSDPFQDQNDITHIYVEKGKDDTFYALRQANYPLIRRTPLANWYHLRNIDDGFLNFDFDEDFVGRHTLKWPNTISRRLLIDPPNYPLIDAPSQSQSPTYFSVGSLASFLELLVLVIGVSIAIIIAVNAVMNLMDATLFWNLLVEKFPTLLQLELRYRSLFSQKQLQLEVSSSSEEYEKNSISSSKNGDVDSVLISNITVSDAIKALEVETPDKRKEKPRMRGSRGKKKRKKEYLALESESKGSSDGRIEKITTVPVTSTVDSVSETEEIIVTKDIEISINNLIISEEILGSGSNGTFVFKGRWEGKDVAVKRMLRECVEIASREVDLLQESDDHPNIIRYYCTQKTSKFLYIALELCVCSLHDYIERPKTDWLDVAKFNSQQALWELASGLDYIHSLKLVHRDLKPGNILLALPRKSSNGTENLPDFSIRISDLGLSKKLELNQSSFGATTAHAAGTVGWRAPELLLEKIDMADAILKDFDETSTHTSESSKSFIGSRRRVTQAIDIFSLGCVFFYILTVGEHPFGNHFLREGNIIKAQYDLSWLDTLGEQGILAKDLIGAMINNDPSLRPRIAQVKRHPFFWHASERLNFLTDLSDRLEHEERDPPSNLLVKFEENAFNVIGADYNRKIDKAVLCDIGKFRKYNNKKIADLLRILRNKRHHYQELHPQIQLLLGPIPDGLSAYFTSRFPNLILHCWKFSKEYLGEEPLLRYYFK